MKVRCERDDTEFEVDPRPYPLPGKQSKFHHQDGDEFIECPTCGRRYFRQDGSDGDEVGWVSDRQLTIL